MYLYYRKKETCFAFSSLNGSFLYVNGILQQKKSKHPLYKKGYAYFKPLLRKIIFECPVVFLCCTTDVLHTNAMQTGVPSAASQSVLG